MGGTGGGEGEGYVVMGWGQESERDHGNRDKIWRVRYCNKTLMGMRCMRRYSVGVFDVVGEGSQLVSTWTPTSL